MTARGLVLVALLAAACGEGAPPPRPAAMLTVVSDAGADAGGDACEAFCAIGDRLACPGATGDCLARCRLGQAGPCAAAGDALIACVLALPPGDFLCDGNGRWQIGPGRCAAEQSAVIRCAGQPPS